MIVGLYDADFFKYHQTIFNLEIMKLASYFKKKKEITMMSPDFAPDRYTYFFYRKDFNDDDFPSNITQYKNLKCGGLAFSSNKYVPLPEEIEASYPDKYIYERFKDLFISDNKELNVNYTSMVRGTHFRLSLDEKNIWSNYKKQLSLIDNGSVFFVHDNNLNGIEGANEVIQSIIDEYNTTKRKVSLCPKFPIQCFDLNDFKKWQFFIQASIYFQLQLNWLLNDEELNYIIESINFSNARNIIYNPVPAASSKNDFSEDILIKIFKQTLFLYTQKKKFLLIYNDSFGIPDEIKKLFDIFSGYIKTRTQNKPLTSLYYFVKQLKKPTIYTKKIMPIEEAREVFLYCQREYPELFKMFYQNSQGTFKGGKIEVE